MEVVIQLYLYDLGEVNYNKFMKGEALKESKILIKSDSFGSELFDDELEMDNPENNFEKLMSMPPDLPGRQLRNLIQSMSEHCSFQKNLIKRTHNVEVPRYVKTEIKRRQVFNDYETIRNYTNFASKKQHFQTRKFTSQSRPASKTTTYDNPSPSPHKSLHKPKSKPKARPTQVSKPCSLFQLVQSKKNQMLMQDNILKTDQTNVSNILNDSKKREKIFQEALFLERLYDIQIEKLKKVGVTEGGHQVPDKFRGVEPKHIRISSQACRTQDEYLRKKYVCKKRKLQFYGHARKIQQSSLKTKKKQNRGVLQTIMKYNQSNITAQSNYFSAPQNKQSQPQIFQQQQKIKKLFLKYSSYESDNPEQMYKYMGEKELDSFFRDFGMGEKLTGNGEIRGYLQKKRDQANYANLKEFQREGKVKYYLFDFIEMLYILAAENSQDKLTCNISEFLSQAIWSKEDKVVPELWQKLKKIKRSNKMIKFLKILNFQEKAKILFQRKTKKSAVSEFTTPVIDFNDLLQMAWQLKLFPTKISKKALRFIYLYSKTNQNGLNLSNFMDLLIIIGLKFCDNEQTQEKLRWISQQISN